MLSQLDADNVMNRDPSPSDGSTFTTCPNTFGQLLGAKRRPEPHLGTVELPEFRVAKEDPVYVLVHLFQPDLFVAKYFADENSTFVPADVSAVVHSP
jgi:hypothetical protein